MSSPAIKKEFKLADYFNHKGFLVKGEFPLHKPNGVEVVLIDTPIDLPVNATIERKKYEEIKAARATLSTDDKIKLKDYSAYQMYPRHKANPLDKMSAEAAKGFRARIEKVGIDMSSDIDRSCVYDASHKKHGDAKVYTVGVNAMRETSMTPAEISIVKGANSFPIRRLEAAHKGGDPKRIEQVRKNNFGG